MIIRSTFAALVLAFSPAVSLAQQGDPMEAARAVDACNGNTIIDAIWMEDGRLGVTCPTGSVEGASGGATNFAPLLLLGLVAGAAALGGGGSSTPSTNTN